jgi:hypothetical protein
MTVTERQAIEKKIITKVIDEAIKAGWKPVAVDDGEARYGYEGFDEAYEDLTAVDESWLILTKGNKVCKVYFVFGNDGWDVVADYSVSLEEFMGVVNDYAETFAVAYN